MADRIHTLSADTVSTVTVAKGPAADEVEVCNLDGAAEVFYRLGTDADATADPTVDDTDADVHVLPATICARTHKRSSTKATVVKLISSGTPKVAVTGR